MAPLWPRRCPPPAITQDTPSKCHKNVEMVSEKDIKKHLHNLEARALAFARARSRAAHGDGRAAVRMAVRAAVARRGAGRGGVGGAARHSMAHACAQAR